MLEYMRTVLNGLKAWVTGEVNKLLSKIDNDIAALRKTLDEASSNFVINATTTSDRESATLDKTFAQIQEAINAGKNPIVLLNNRAYLRIADVDTEYIAFSGASGDDRGASFDKLYVYPDQEPQLSNVFSLVLNTDDTMPQVSMESEPTLSMQIATKQYVDNSVAGSGGVTTLHINVTAVNSETMEATFTADKTPEEMQQASVNGPVWCVVTFAAGLMEGGSVSFGVPPAWYGGAPAFGGLVELIHSDAGDNDVGYVIRAAAGFDGWVFDIRQFGS